MIIFSSVKSTIYLEIIIIYKLYYTRSHSDRRIESKDDDRHSHSHVLSVEQSTLTSHSLTIKSTMSVRAEINIKSSCPDNKFSQLFEVEMFSKMSSITTEVVLTRCIDDSRFEGLRSNIRWKACRHQICIHKKSARSIKARGRIIRQ